MFSALFRRRKKKSSASIAKERLQIIVAHERNQNSQAKQPDFLNALQKDILEVVRKYMPIDSDQIKIAMDKEDGCDVLELNIVLLEQDEKTEHEKNQQVDESILEAEVIHPSDADLVENNETR